MAEGEAKETAKAAGVALSARFAEKREAAFGQKVVNLEEQQARLAKAKVEKDEQARLAAAAEKDEQARLAEEARLRVLTAAEDAAAETRARRKRRGANPPPAKKK
jgi:hypothetical protein